MRSADIEKFIEEIVPTMLEAGAFALAQQGRVENVGKEVQVRAEEINNDFLVQRQQAKTVVDEQVQERLLSAAHKILGQSVRIDAEEATPSTKLFTTDADTTLVLDPIDGTLQYVNGSPEFSLNLGLVSQGSISAAIVYFPAHKTLYLLDAEGYAYRCLCDEQGIAEKQLLTAPAEVKNETVYVNHRVPNQECLARSYRVIKDADNEVLWTDGFFKVQSGEYKAALFLRPQIWDVLLGAIIAAIPGGYAVDFKGDKVHWPDGGRVQEVAFGFGELPVEIKECLNRTT